jgi:Holliday junction DNA helicase RuvA
MLSSLDQNKSQMQLHQQMLSIQSIKGIGVKLQRVILDLKEKVLKLYDLDEVSMSQSNTNRDEALSALEVLGFVRKTSEKIIEKIVKEDPELLWNLLKKL